MSNNYQHAMWYLYLEAYETKIGEYVSFNPMGPTLRHAIKLMRGIPCAEMTVRRHGSQRAWLKNNWRGDLASVEIMSPHTFITTSMNPNAVCLQERT